jgi:RNA polymerase sporulation-specific sigma factor
LDDELRLIRAASSGNAEAFASLFRNYRPRVFAVARQYFAPGSEQDDVLQEATIGFFKAIRDFKHHRGAFSAFADLCVRRQVITFIKTATRNKHSPLNHATSLDATPANGSTEPLVGRLAANIQSSEIDAYGSNFLQDLWLRCSHLERGVLSMYSKGYRFDEMAYELGVQSKSIDNAVWRVKVKAKKLAAESSTTLS